MAFDAFALMLAMLALGMLYARLQVFPEDAADMLNLVGTCLPAAILRPRPSHPPADKPIAQHALMP